MRSHVRTPHHDRQGCEAQPGEDRLHKEPDSRLLDCDAIDKAVRLSEGEEIGAFK